MCKLSWNIVPNVYNSLQSSFLSLAWPWPGRSLPKGNQWECWDPGKGSLPSLAEVSHSPRGTSGSAGTLDWGPMWLHFQSTCNPNAPLTPLHSLTPPTACYTLGDPQCPLMLPIPLLAPEYLHSLPAPILPLHPLMAPIATTPLGYPNAPFCYLYPFWPLSTYTPWQPPIHPWHSLHPWFPQCPHWVPTPPRSPQMPFMLPISLLVVNCHHFATDHLHTVKMLIFYCCHFQLSSLCKWPSSQVCPVYKIPSLDVKNTSAVLWSSTNFCSISKNMHYKDPVASQHWKTNRVVWTWKDDWPPWRTSTYKRPFTWEGTYLVSFLSCIWLPITLWFPHFKM